jgi:YHS domain-containing protein
VCCGSSRIIKKGEEMIRKLKIAASVMGIVGLMALSAPVTYGATVTVGPGAKSKVVGNKICPVTGEKISKKTEVKYEYKGKIYSFCCQSCIPEFKKNPQKYIEKIK